jgi:CRISPR-associated protein Cas2
MQYVVCYDIADDARRSRISQVLLDFGVRVQESVFVAHLDDPLVARLRDRMLRVVDKEQDRVHMFQICGACEKKASVLGDEPVSTDPEFYVI